MTQPCTHPACEFETGHEAEHPHGIRIGANYQPEACWIRDLAVGDLISIDQWYGVERIVSVHDADATDGVTVRNLGLRWATPLYDEQYSRNVMRGSHEPVVRWVAA